MDCGIFQLNFGFRILCDRILIGASREVKAGNFCLGGGLCEQLGGVGSLESFVSRTDHDRISSRLTNSSHNKTLHLAPELNIL